MGANIRNVRCATRQWTVLLTCEPNGEWIVWIYDYPLQRGNEMSMRKLFNQYQPEWLKR